MEFPEDRIKPKKKESKMGFFEFFTYGAVFTCAVILTIPEIKLIFKESVLFKIVGIFLTLLIVFLLTIRLNG